jgi:3-methyl-2-oxobutanoate hydroxymethyltransferase
VVLGHASTLKISIDQLISATRSVKRAVDRPLVVSDMPYGSYHLGTEETVRNALRLVREGGAQAVKLEGGHKRASLVQDLVEADIPVMGHIGLQPQSVLTMGGYKVQGKDEVSAKRIIDDALALEAWGVQMLVLECVPAALAKQVSQALSIPTIGIGAGLDCDGQVLVSYDMLGINTKHLPRFVKNFLKDNNDIQGAVNAFISAVKDQTFPGDEHSY